MKKITTLLLLLVCFLSNAQDFPGNDVELLNGKMLKVKPRKPELQKYGYNGFYKNEKMKQKYSCCESYNSKYESLVDKVFSVISIEPYEYLGDTKYKIKLSNSETGELFFDYNPNPLFEFNFVFEVIGGLTFPNGYFCKEIEIAIDKFTNDTTFSSKESDGIKFIKVKNLNSSRIYLSISQVGSTLNVGTKGLTLLLENNKRIERTDAEVDVKVNPYGNGYIYSIFIALTNEDINLLTQNPITDKRLYVYDGKVTRGKKIVDYLKCITTK